MSNSERMIRIALTSLLVVYGLLSISQSGYGFMHWLIRPDERPEAWLQQGITAGGRALLAVVVAVVLQFSWQQLQQSWRLKLALVLGGVVFIGSLSFAG